MYENILQQREAIKLEQQQTEQKLQELNNKKEMEEEEAKRALLNEFDKTQNSMLGNRHHTNSKNEQDVDKPKSDKSEHDSISSNNSSGKKRKFEFTEEDIRSVAEKDIERTSLQLKVEKEEAAKPKIASFWVVMLEVRVYFVLLNGLIFFILCL